MSGTFVFGGTVLNFLFAALAALAIGIGAAWGTRWALCATEDGYTQIGVTLLVPYIAWVIAESVHASAVLACVAGGITLRQYFSGAVAPATRLQARAVWELLIFILNGVIFSLIGLQLGALRDAVPAGQYSPVLFAGLMVSATAILVRFFWVPLGALIPRWLSATLRARDPVPPWKGLFLISWTGMRGIVTLAAALAIPMTTGSGAPFPFRSEIILISFTVILVTLVLQGLSLPPIIRWLRLEEEHELEREERLARQHAATAALTRLNQVLTENWVGMEQIERVRLRYLRRLEHLTPAGLEKDDHPDGSKASVQRLHHEALTAERLALIGLRDDGTISDEVLHQLEQELDVAALHQGVGERRAGAGYNMPIHIAAAQPVDAPVIAKLVGDLLHEIVAAIKTPAFGFSLADTEARARAWLEDGRYTVLLARDEDCVAGFVALSQCRALYAEGRFGIIPELYVRPDRRSQGVGGKLVTEAKRVARSNGWVRLEVTSRPWRSLTGPWRFPKHRIHV